MVSEEGGSMQEAAEPKEILVFSILRDSKCEECGERLSKGSFLTMENSRPHCLECADLDHLVYLERGDVCITRRAKKYSSLSAIVLKFSRSRHRGSGRRSVGQPRIKS